MTCAQSAELLDLYLDDALPTEARQKIENHLLVCRNCAWEAESLRITRERLRGDVGEVVASDAFRARTLARLAHDNPHVAAETPAATDADASQFRLPISF